MRTPEMIAPGRGNGAGADGGVQGRSDKANSALHGATVIVFRASYSLEELRQHHAAHGNRVREIAARVALAALRLVWRALP